MGRKLAASLITILIAAPLAGCTAHAQIGGGSTQEPAPPPAQPAPAPAPTPEPAPQPKPVNVTSKVKQKGNKLEIPGPIVFEFGKATLMPESEAALAQLKDFLVEKKQITLLRIEGHTDNVGQTAANLKLSGERALAVRQWLVDHGIESKRLIAIGFGDLKPVADNGTDEGRAQNRRTDFIVVEVGDKPWLGADPTGGGTVFGDNPR